MGAVDAIKRFQPGIGDDEINATSRQPASRLLRRCACSGGGETVKVGPGDTKNRNRRRVPIAGTLREHLAAERLRQPHGVEPCFGLGDGRPFSPRRLQERADEAWKSAKLTLHDCRDTFASFAIAAGVNARALSSYMGHSGVPITLDRYGHLMPATKPRPRRCSMRISTSHARA